MPFLTTLAIIVAAVAGITTVVVLVMLYWDDIINWFKQREELKLSDNDHLAITVLETLESGNYSVVQGIFNTRTKKMVDGTKYEAENIDEELAKKHRKDKVVIYT